MHPSGFFLIGVTLSGLLSPAIEEQGEHLRPRKKVVPIHDEASLHHTVKLAYIINASLFGLVLSAFTFAASAQASPKGKKDKKEDVRDKKEDVRDKREDVRDAAKDGGLKDKLEDIRDKKEDKKDRKEDVRDKKEDKKDRRGDAGDKK